MRWRALAIAWLASLFAGAGWTAAARAQPRAQPAARAPCPDVEPGAPAADQALCWLYRQRGQDAACAPTASGTDTCTAAAAAWCRDDDDATDDADVSDPQVAGACLLALVGARRLEAARAVAPYAAGASGETQACVAAMTQGLRARVVSDPAGALVAVDGRRYGPAPQDVQLAAPFWEHRVEITPPGGARERPVTLGPPELRARFDTRRCAMDDLLATTERPISAAPPGPVRARPRPGRRRASARPATEPDAAPSGLALGLTVGGAALAVAGGVLLAVAEVGTADLLDDRDGTPWTEAEGRYDAIAPLRWAGGITLGVGVLAAGTGVAWLLTGGRARSPERADARALRLELGAGAVRLRWRSSP